MQSAQQEMPPVGIVFDCDMGDSIDDALALAMLYGAATSKEPEARIVSISVSKSNLRAAAFCDAVALFYSNEADREIPPRFRRSRTLPVGLAGDGESSEDTPMLTVPLGKRHSDGTPVYPHNVEKLTDTAEPAAVIRNAFTAQHDQNCIAVLTGPAANLARVLELRGAKELIERKVKFLSMMGGAYPEGGPEYNIKADIAAARKLFAEWPTPIVAAGYEVGENLLFPASSIENDFGWTERHPIADAYRAHGEMPYDAPAWDLAAALYAVRPDAGYFELSEPGEIEVLDDGRTRFKPSSGGSRRHLILDPSQKQRVIDTFVELASARPEPREPPRFLQRLIEEERQKEEEERKKREQSEAAPGPR